VRSFSKTPGTSWDIFGKLKGATTSVLLATSPLLQGIGGRYFEDCNQARSSQPGTGRGVAPYALDPDAATRLWEISLQTLKS
jgi:hypothetical protein